MGSKIVYLKDYIKYNIDNRKDLLRKAKREEMKQKMSDKNQNKR